MAATINRLPFDQTDRRYLCFCEQLHIRKGSRMVAIFLNIIAVVNLIFSVTRSSAVAVYSLMSSAFAVVIIGSLTYGVYKEKRMYLVPYLIFQLISIGMTMIVLVVLVIAIATNSTMVVELAKDIGNIDMHLDQQQLNHAITSFTMIFVLVLCVGGVLQAYFFEVIYSFYCFLDEREHSFNFNGTGIPTQLPSTNIALDTTSEATLSY